MANRRRTPPRQQQVRNLQRQAPLPKEPWYTGIASWAVQNIALGIFATVLSTAIISGSAYLLYDGQSALDENDSVMQELADRSEELKRGSDMANIYTHGWNSDRGNMTHAAELLKVLVAKKKEGQPLDGTFAKSTIDWCTNGITQLESEQTKIQTFIVHDEFLKRNQSILVADYAATIKLIEGLREMVLAWSQDTDQQRNARLESIETAAREARKAETAHETLGQQSDSYWSSKIEEDRIKKDHALHRFREIRIKTDLAFVGLFLGAILLVPSIAIVIIRFRFR